MFKFLTTFGKNKINNAAKGLTQALVAFDPETATETQIDEMSSHLDKVGEEYAKARMMYEKEKKEADTIVSLYNKRLQTAELLQTKLDAETDEAKKGEIGKALNELVSMLETMAADVEREQEEASEAKEFMDELEISFKASSESLKTARKKLEKATKDMKIAKMRQDRSKDREDQAKVAAGVKKQADSLNLALESMGKQTEISNAKSEASKMKAKLLKPTVLEENSIISDAMKEVSGESPKSANITDRLAALKK